MGRFQPGSVLGVIWDLYYHTRYSLWFVEYGPCFSNSANSRSSVQNTHRGQNISSKHAQRSDHQFKTCPEIRSSVKSTPRDQIISSKHTQRSDHQFKAHSEIRSSVQSTPRDQIISSNHTQRSTRTNIFAECSHLHQSLNINPINISQFTKIIWVCLRALWISVISLTGVHHSGLTRVTRYQCFPEADKSWNQNNERIQTEFEENFQNDLEQKRSVSITFGPCKASFCLILSFTSCLPRNTAILIGSVSFGDLPLHGLPMTGRRDDDAAGNSGMVQPSGENSGDSGVSGVCNVQGHSLSPSRSFVCWQLLISCCCRAVLISNWRYT